jgi:hypothetical protein
MQSGLRRSTNNVAVVSGVTKYRTSRFWLKRRYSVHLTYQCTHLMALWKHLSHSNLGHGIVNLALFLAHASTRGLRLNTCDEMTESDTDAECPMSTAAMRCPVLVDSITRW